MAQATAWLKGGLLGYTQLFRGGYCKVPVPTGATAATIELIGGGGGGSDAVGANGGGGGAGGGYAKHVTTILQAEWGTLLTINNTGPPTSGTRQAKVAIAPTNGGQASIDGTLNGSAFTITASGGVAATVDSSTGGATAGFGSGANTTNATGSVGTDGSGASAGLGGAAGGSLADGLNWGKGGKGSTVSNTSPDAVDGVQGVVSIIWSF